MRNASGPAAGAPAVLLAGLLAVAGQLHAQATLSLDDGAAKPNQSDLIAVMAVGNPGATALQLDVTFDPTRLVALTPSGSPGLVDHLIFDVQPQAGLVRILVYSPTSALLPVGEVVRLPFMAQAAADTGLTPLAPIAAELATPGAAAVLPLTLSPGSFHVFALEADLELQLAADRNLVANGDPLGYTLVATNPGPDLVTGVDVSDPIPAGLTAGSWSCVAGGGASCTAAGVGDLTDTVDLPVGGATTYTLTGTVDTASTFIDNLAELAVPDEAFDPDTMDNSDSVSVDVCVIDNEVLTNWDIGGVAVFNACVTLTAGPDFNVQPTGDVTLRALGSVILANGVSVESGGRLSIETP